jgi:hypothetical protein
MKNQQRDVVGQFALVVAVVGVTGYIGMSSGLFDRFSFPKAAPVKEEKSPAQMKQEWRAALNEISQDSLEKQKELEDLTSRLARIRVEIQDRESEINRFGKSEPKRKRSSDPVQVKFKSLSQLEQYLVQDFGAERFSFDTRQVAGQLASTPRLFSMHRPFADDSVFLRRSGLRWAKAVSKAAYDLKASKVIIRYLDGESEYKRAEVLKRFIQDQLTSIGSDTSDKLQFPRVEMESVASDQVVSSSSIDLYIQLSDAGTDAIVGQRGVE